jgi:hypothetical protein
MKARRREVLAVSANCPAYFSPPTCWGVARRAEGVIQQVLTYPLPPTAYSPARCAREKVVSAPPAPRALTVARPICGLATGLLNGRTRHVCVTAKDTAIARLGLQHHLASLAFVKELAGVCWHGFNCHVATQWTGDGCGQLHYRMVTTVAGYPALADASAIASGMTRVSS